MSTRRDISSAERAASALTGYVAGSMVVVPFDRVKTLMQAHPGTHSSATSVARHVFRQDGLRGLYRGLDTQLLIAPFTVIYYSTYDELLHLQNDHPLAPLSAAVVARTLEVTMRMPLEIFRTQLQASEGRLDLKTLVQEQRARPLSSWMQGYSMTLLRDVPFSAVYWFAYEFVKRELPEPNFIPSAGVRTLLHSFLCGGSAGVLAAFVTTPADVIKTLRQKLAEGELPSASGPKSGAYQDIFGYLWAHPSAALRGLAPRLLRIPLGMATMMSAMETCKWAFEWRKTER